MGASLMVTIRFFRGRLGDWYHSDGDNVPIPHCLAVVVPRDTLFGVLTLQWGKNPSARLQTLSDSATILVPRNLTAAQSEELLAHYRELDIDTELE